MNHAIDLLKGLIGLAFGAVLAATVYWALIQNDGINRREDNPRLVRAEQTLVRGTIYDRHNMLLAYSLPEPTTGIMKRIYPYPAAVGAVGHYSFRYGSEGIESAYDPILRGDDPPPSAWDRWQTRWFNRSQHGYDLRSTLDINLQQQLITSFAGQHGAAIIVDVPSGQIRAMVSLPMYDPNSIETDLPSLLKSAKKGDTRLFNRAQEGLYQPGSAIQLVLLSSLLTDGYQLTDRPSLPQSLQLPPALLSIVACENIPPGWTLQQHFQMACPQAFIATWDTQRYTNQVLDAGFLEPPYFIGGDTDHTPQLIPPVLFPLPTQAAHLEATGQGQLLVSPLHFAQWISAIANGGSIPTLTLADAYRIGDGEWEALALPPLQVLMPPEIATSMRAAMQLGNGIYGHTGEAWRGEALSRQSWFNGFAELPSGSAVVIVVVVENAPATDSAAQIALPILVAMRTDQ